MDITLYDNSGYGAVESKVKDAERALASKDIRGAMDCLSQARRQSNVEITKLKGLLAATRNPVAADQIRDIGARIQTLRNTKIVTAMDALQTMLADRARNVQEVVQAPPGAGAFVRIPLTSTVGSTTLPWAYLAPADNTAVTMQASDIPYLKYRVHSVMVSVQQTAAGLADSVFAYDLKARGSNTLLLDEGRYSVDTFDFENISVQGLRNLVDIVSPNKPQITVNALGSAAAVRGGATIVYASVIVEILEDDDARFGSINSHEVRFGTDTARIQGNYGYLGFKGIPLPGNLQRVPMRPSAAAGSNTTTDPQLYLDATTPSITVTTNTLPFASCKVVGFEVGKPVQNNELDVVTVEDLKVKGGFSLFPQEDEVPLINYYRREGGVHSMAGLRCYPRMSETNQATATIEGWAGSLGTSAMLGAVRVSGVNLLVDVMQDDNFGPGIVSPYAIDNARRLLRG